MQAKTSVIGGRRKSEATLCIPLRTGCQKLCCRMSLDLPPRCMASDPMLLDQCQDPVGKLRGIHEELLHYAATAFSRQFYMHTHCYHMHSILPQSLQQEHPRADRGAESSGFPTATRRHPGRAAEASGFAQGE